MKTLAAAACGAFAPLALLAAPAAALPAAPAATPVQPLITIGVSSAVHAAPWQVCASDVVAGAGANVSANSPDMVQGDCRNNQTAIRYAQPGVISILDGTSLDVAPWQFCAANAVGGVGATVVTSSPKLVDGSCHNSNTTIAPDGAHAPSVISVLSGSAVKVAPWQVCGSTAVAGLGTVVAHNSPTVVTGDCTNAGVNITPQHATTLPVLSGVDLPLLPLQACGDASLLSLVGLGAPLNSDGHVLGTCYRPNGIPAA